MKAGDGAQMADHLAGTINEARRSFEGGGLTGKVDFGSQADGLTRFRVTLSDGRKGFGAYKSPERVAVHLYRKPKRVRVY